MGSTFAKKYFLVSAEAGGQEMMEMMEMMAAAMGKSLGELMCLEFPGGNKIKITMNGEEIESDFTEDGNALTVEFYGDGMKMIVDGNAITMDMGGTIMVFSDAPLAEEDGSEGESGEITHALDGVTVTLELPEKGWCSERDKVGFPKPVLCLYHLPSLKKKGMFNSEISITAQKSAEDFNVPGNPDFKSSRKEIENRIIGGIDMAGRTWETTMGMINAKYTDYIGAINDSCAVCVSINNMGLDDAAEAADFPLPMVAPVKIDVESGEVKAILDSIKFDD